MFSETVRRSHTGRQVFLYMPAGKSAELTAAKSAIMEKMNPLNFQKFQEEAARNGILQLVLKAAFIAAVGFGAPAGVLAAAFPRTFFGLTEGIACPSGAEMQYEEWNDGDGTQFRTFCVDASGQEVKDRTLLALGVLLGAFFLAIFYIALVVLLIQRAVIRRKYGGDS